MTAPQKHQKYDALIRRCEALAPVCTAVVHPCDETSLRAVVEGAALKLIDPIIVAPRERLRALARSLGIDLRPFELIDAPHSHASAEKAVEIARAGRVDALMKGSLHTGELMAAVAHRDVGLRTGRRMSHVFTYFAGADAAGLVLGARVPIVLTSRADNLRARMASCAVALLSAWARTMSGGSLPTGH